MTKIHHGWDPVESAESSVPDGYSDESPTGPPAPFSELTPRELETVRLLALGKRNRDIAKAMEISIKTVDTHRSHVLKKLGLTNNVELARLAIFVGFVPNEDPR